MKNGSVLAGGVGSGKTYAALAYYVEKVLKGDLKRDRPASVNKSLLVITTAKKRNDLDWHTVGLAFGLSADPSLSYSKAPFVVDSWNNIKKYADITNTLLVLDEQRLVGSGAWVKAFLKMVKNEGVEWIMLTATPADTWMDYLPLFLAHGFYRNRTEFIDEHVAWHFTGKYRQIRGFYGVSHLRALRDSILVEMPFERHTIRHLVAVPVEHDEEAFRRVWIRRWNVYEDAPLIDVAEKHRVARRVVNSDISRLEAIEKLWAEHPRMIIFYSFDYELELLRSLAERRRNRDKTGGVGASLPLIGDCLSVTGEQYCDSCEACRDDFEIAEWNGHKHEKLPNSDRWLYLVQYQAGAEGWNCVDTDTIIFYSLTYSHKIFEQAQGRIDRLNTPFTDLYYYILISSGQIDQVIWKALLAKKNFHEGRNRRFSNERRTVKMDKIGQ